ncbi:UNVERIFIED_CONTAM: hypothetical protein FKN15_060298 [Acipenser sinensis]
MDRNALAELLQALESRRDAEERRREERYTALIERTWKTIKNTLCTGIPFVYLLLLHRITATPMPVPTTLPHSPTMFLFGIPVLGSPRQGSSWPMRSPLLI